MRLVLIILLALSGTASSPYARTWVVGPDGDGDAPSLQAAIDSALHGDTVLAKPGTYFVNLNLRGKAIHFKSQAGPHATILDGSQGDYSVVTCDSGEDYRTIIEGFTICHGKGGVLGIMGRRGAGILADRSSPTIRGNIIRDNRAVSTGPNPYEQSRGGGIRLAGATDMALIEGNLFENNFATSLGGAFIGGPVHLRNNTFIGNSVELGDGGAVYFGEAATLVENNLFVDNVAGDHGGAIYITNPVLIGIPAHQLVIKNNIMIGNSANNVDTANDCSGGAIWFDGKVTIVGNTIAFNFAEASVGLAAAGICVSDSGPDTRIERNLIYRNQRGGIVATPSRTLDGIVRRNLIFGNGPEDLIVEPTLGGAEIGWVIEENVVADPLFCVIGTESRGELAGASPALNGEYGPIGAVWLPTCGPAIALPVVQTTWGRIKVRFRDGE